MFRDLVLKNRSYRRFDETRPVSRETLLELVELARLSPSGANLQPLKFVLSAAAERNALIFPHLSWAGYLTDWAGPVAGERPTGYVVMLFDTEISESAGCDHGIAAQTILLGAAERGLGGCMIGSINRDSLRVALGIDERYKIVLVLALGTAVETVKLETATPESGIRYWRDAEGVHHVPKRPLSELIID